MFYLNERSCSFRSSSCWSFSVSYALRDCTRWLLGSAVSKLEGGEEVDGGVGKGLGGWLKVEDLRESRPFNG